MGDAAELAAIQAENDRLRAELGLAPGGTVAPEPAPAAAILAVDPSRFTHRMGCVCHSTRRGHTHSFHCSALAFLAASMRATSRRRSWGKGGEWLPVPLHVSVYPTSVSPSLSTRAQALEVRALRGSALTGTLDVGLDGSWRP